MIIATYSTPYFDFTAVGQTREDVEEALLIAWAKHCGDFLTADPGLMVEAITEGEVNFLENLPDLPATTVLRDGAILHTTA